MSQSYQQQHNKSGQRPVQVQSIKQTQSESQVQGGPLQLNEVIEVEAEQIDSITLNTTLDVVSDPATLSYVVDQFKDIVAHKLSHVFVGKESPANVKIAIRQWYTELNMSDQETYRNELKEAALYIMAQVEDVLNDAPVLFL